MDDLIKRIEQLEKQQKDLMRTLVALSNTLRVVDSAAFLALANHKSIEIPESKDALNKTYEFVTPYINEMLKLVANTTDTNKEADEK